MALTKVRQLDSVELLTEDRVRVRVSTFFRDGAVEQIARDPEVFNLDPTKPGHQAAIQACRSAFNSVFTAVGANR